MIHFCLLFFAKLLRNCLQKVHFCFFFYLDFLLFWTTCSDCKWCRFWNWFKVCVSFFIQQSTSGSHTEWIVTIVVVVVCGGGESAIKWENETLCRDCSPILLNSLFFLCGEFWMKVRAICFWLIVFSYMHNQNMHKNSCTFFGRWTERMDYNLLKKKFRFFFFNYLI